MSTPLPPSPPTATQTDKVADFCQVVTSRHPEKWPIDENALAEEFVGFVGLDSFLIFGTLRQFCQDQLRIPVSFAPLPTELRGYNGSYGDRREILISLNQDFPGADLHTLLHELREILERTFEKFGKPTVNREDSDLEQRAESFAISVQICATHNMLPSMLDKAAEIERKWLRIGACALLAAGALIYVFACASLPLIEDAFAAQRLARRNVIRRNQREI